VIDSLALGGAERILIDLANICKVSILVMLAGWMRGIN